jgi:aminoglycoside phosphotransferase family enzyme/predicted kinase
MESFSEAHEESDVTAEGSLVAAMMDPEFYSKPGREVTHQETHISHLFFVDGLVYKIKKPVRFSFLDFSTPERRGFYLQQELQLNRRLAPSIYLGVLPIGLDESGWRLNDWDVAREYVLLMRRLPAKRMLSFLLATDQVTPAMMGELASVLARFHSAAMTIRDIDPEAYVAALKGQWEENISDLKPFIHERADRDTLEAIDEFGKNFLGSHRDLLLRRVEEGWIRDVHGDLHAEHICYATEGIQVFDCIEFSAELRRCDLASEIAFLLMDLVVHGGASLVEPFRARYNALINDPALHELLPYFECYRAMVRAKVHCLRTRGWNNDAENYFRFAARLVWRKLHPFAVMLCGLTGTGKSTLARELARRLDLTVISSDVVRKRIAGTTGRQLLSFDQGIYSQRMTEKTYSIMAREAEKEIAAGRGVTLDATFIRRTHREKIARLAAKHQIPLFVIHCSASDETTRNRLSHRLAQHQEISDGRWEIYLQQKAVFEPLDELALGSRLEIDSELPLACSANLCEDFLRSRLRSIRSN